MKKRSISQALCRHIVFLTTAYLYCNLLSYRPTDNLGKKLNDFIKHLELDQEEPHPFSQGGQ